MEKKREIKDEHIAVKNLLYQELPTHEITIQSGRTYYRFTGSYDGQRSLPHKVLQLMARFPLDEANKERSNAYKQSCIGRLPAEERSKKHVQAVWPVPKRGQNYRPLLPLIPRRSIDGRQQQHCQSKGDFKQIRF